MEKYYFLEYRLLASVRLWISWKIVLQINALLLPRRSPRLGKCLFIRLLKMEMKVS